MHLCIHTRERVGHGPVGVVLVEEPHGIGLADVRFVLEGTVPHLLAKVLAIARITHTHIHTHTRTHTHTLKVEGGGLRCRTRRSP